MNCDGADGAEEIKKMGGKVIAEARTKFMCNLRNARRNREAKIGRSCASSG